jgi:serine/threonine-protein kinase
MAGFEEGDFFADRYEVKRQLGRGGMGMVYLAKDWKTQKHVALKTLLPKFAQLPQAVARFEREINAARKIDHRAIVQIFDSGKVNGTLYYAMEYIEGKSVRAWMRERKRAGKRIGLGSSVRILGVVCSALEKAHAFTIHRDLSPENVMVTRDGQVKLLDFGLAKLTDSNQDLTRVGVTLGKLQYSSPEQRADAKNVDHRSDIYSLGVMFFELLSGELPKPGVKLTSVVPWLPPEADAFVDRAMAADPNERFQTAREFRKAMMLVYEHSKDLEREPEPGHRAPEGVVAFEDPEASQRAQRAAREAEAQAAAADTPAESRRSGWRGALSRFWRRLVRR